MPPTAAHQSETPTMQLETAGSGGGPALVLVGGGLTGALSWTAHADRLAPTRPVARAQPLAVQYALEGRRLPRQYGVRTESQALLRALDARGWTAPLDLVGWSSGGLIALDLALEHPDRIRSLTLVEPSAFWVLPDHGRGHPALRELEAAERRWASGVSEDDLAEFLTDAAVVPAGQSPRAHPRWPIWVRHRQALAASYPEFEHRDDIARLRSLRRPVLLVTGEGTATYFSLVIDALAGLLPDNRVLRLPGGHAVPLVAMDRFLEEMTAFQATAVPKDSPRATLDDKGLQLATEVKGRGPLLLLVGGGLTGSLSWVPHQERLAKSRRVARVQPLSVQLGLTRQPLPDGYSVNVESQALSAVAAALSPVEAVDLVGWSFGGLIALDFALDHPERIRTLTLIEPPAMWILDATAPLDEASLREAQQLRTLFEQMTDDMTEAQLATFIRSAGLCPPGKTPESLPQWPTWWQHRFSLRNGLATFAHEDRIERLSTFNPPVLLVKGTGSSRFLHRIVDKLADTLPNTWLLELPGGHAPQIVAIDRFLDRLAAFQAR